MFLLGRIAAFTLIVASVVPAVWGWVSPETRPSLLEPPASLVGFVVFLAAAVYLDVIEPKLFANKHDPRPELLDSAPKTVRMLNSRWFFLAMLLVTAFVFSAFTVFIAGVPQTVSDHAWNLAIYFVTVFGLMFVRNRTIKSWRK